jgi:hypothetical protein
MLLPLLLGVGNTSPASGEFADIDADMGSAAAQGVSAMRKLGGVILLCVGCIRSEGAHRDSVVRRICMKYRIANRPVGGSARRGPRRVSKSEVGQMRGDLKPTSPASVTGAWPLRVPGRHVLQGPG